MEQFPLQFTAPPVINEADSTRMVESVTLSGHGNISRIKVEKTPMEMSLKDGHVEVQVHYCGLSFTDNYLRLGIIRNYKFPVIMGSECSGYVIRVATDVKGVKVGHKVLCLQMQGGLFRQIVHVPEKHCFRVPDDMDFKDAVGLGLNFVVAHLCLFEIGHLKPKDRVFMQSIAGGVGTALVQLCRTVPDVEVFGTASEMKQDPLLSLGMKRVYCQEENYVERMLRFFPEGADIVINSNGGRDTEICCRLLKQCGKLIDIGSNCSAVYPQSTTWGLTKPVWDTSYLSTAELINRNCRVAGLNVGVWLERHPEKVQRTLAEVFELHQREQIQPCVHAVIPFSRVTDGLKELCERKNYGKVILDLGQVSGPPTEPVELSSEPQPGKSSQEHQETEPEEKVVVDPEELSEILEDM